MAFSSDLTPDKTSAVTILVAVLLLQLANVLKKQTATDAKKLCICGNPGNHLNNAPVTCVQLHNVNWLKKVFPFFLDLIVK